MHQLENLWRCRGVLQQTGDTSESICIYLPKMNEAQRFKFDRIYINYKIVFTVAFSGEQNLNRRLHRPFLKKGNSPAFNSPPPKFIFLNLSSFLFLWKKFYGGIEMNFGWLVASIAVPPICFLIKYHCTNGLYYFSRAITNQVPLH